MILLIYIIKDTNEKQMMLSVKFIYNFVSACFLSILANDLHSKEGGQESL